MNEDYHLMSEAPAHHTRFIKCSRKAVQVTTYLWMQTHASNTNNG